MSLRWVWNDKATMPDAAAVFISLKKPGWVYRACRRPEDAVHIAQSATVNELARVHDLKYVMQTMAGESPNGFGSSSALVMKQVLAANGVMIQAIETALEYPDDVVCAPVSGFHHALYKEAQGYCTFNGLLAGIVKARITYPVPKVLIIDGDAHYGNGTDDIIGKLVLGGITNLTHKDRGPNALSQHMWRQQIEGLLANHEWDLVIYQAGADAIKDDPLLGGYMTDIDWDDRDQMIFSACRRHKFPLVFNLAGGYNGQRTLDLHARTINTARALYKTSSLVKES